MAVIRCWKGGGRGIGRDLVGGRSGLEMLRLLRVEGYQAVYRSCYRSSFSCGQSVRPDALESQPWQVHHDSPGSRAAH
eukprot:366328-Chlamydomonas_euryale.AAC.8